MRVHTLFLHCCGIVLELTRWPQEFWAKYDGFGGVALAFQAGAGSRVLNVDAGPQSQESETGVTALHRAAAFGWPQQVG